MKRPELESKVKMEWSTDADRGVRQCEGSLALSVAAFVDPIVLRAVGRSQGEIERATVDEVRRVPASKLLGDHETEIAKLRRAVEKWGRRAMAGSMSRQLRPGDWETELQGDLK